MSISKRRRELCLASVLALAALTGTAGAADLGVRAPIAPPVVPWSWTGFYIGIGGGTAWGTKEYDWNIDATIASVLNQVGAPGAIPPLGLHSQGTHSINGGFFGGQIGYNWQVGWAVLGVQADAHWADLNGSGNCFALAITNCNAKVDSFGSVTARVGGTIDRALLYAKGGWAWENSSSDINILGIGATNVLGGAIPGGVNLNLASSVSEDRSGWTWGAGVEYAFASNWSGFLEYNYYDFGKKTQNYLFSVSVPAVPANVSIPIPTDLNEQFHVVKAGVNYRFNWWSAPAY
jgi:outer membrane immunogenic protein